MLPLIHCYRMHLKNCEKFMRRKIPLMAKTLKRENFKNFSFLLCKILKVNPLNFML